MDRRSRSKDARQNLSQWNQLLDEAGSLRSRIQQVAEEVEASLSQITQVWQSTADEIDSTRRDVAEATDSLASEREASSEFQTSDAADPPDTVPEERPLHGDPDLPDWEEFELPPVVEESELDHHFESVEATEPERPEQPEPFTEQSWFELHSRDFPIGEDVFTEEVDEEVADAETTGPDSRDTEREDRPERSRDSPDKQSEEGDSS